MLHAIYLRRACKVILPQGEGTTPFNAIVTLQKNIESLGYLLGEDIAKHLETFSPAQLDTFYRRLVKSLKELVGAHVNHRPFYPNFPTQVMNLSEAQLYFNAIHHYWNLHRPVFGNEPRPPMPEMPARKLIQKGSTADFDSLFQQLLRSKTPYSPQDKADVQWYIAQYRDKLPRLVPEMFPCGENFTSIASAWLRDDSP